MGPSAIAITDRGVVQAFPEAYQAAKKTGIKVIYGLEGYLVDDGVPIVIGATTETITASTYVVFDLETTGLNPFRNEIIEIGAVKIINGQIGAQFTSLIKPQGEISPEIQKLTGITPEMVKEAPSLAEILPAWLEFMADAVLVAHNAKFDVGFFNG